MPNTVLVPINFEPLPSRSARDTDSLASLAIENGEAAGEANNPLYRNTMALYAAPAERESQQPINAKNMPRSYSMPAYVPVPPPMPPASESQTPTPSGTLKRNMAAAGALAGEHIPSQL